MSDRIKACFDACQKKGRAAFVSYMCAGDPDFDTSLEICRTLIENGTDILELGVPFSDPLADGLTNQLAAERALASGIDQSQVFQLVAEIRKFSDIPIVFYTYYNLIYSQGVDTYVRRAKEAGVDGILTLDLPPEESDDFVNACESHGIKTVYIIAPTTPKERINLIAEKATGFLYYVSQEGVTGERTELALDIKEKVEGIRAETGLPLVVGFGISTPAHVKAVAALADGVVVGSALVNCIADQSNDKKLNISNLKTKISELSGAL